MLYIISIIYILIGGVFTGFYISKNKPVSITQPAILLSMFIWPIFFSLGLGVYLYEKSNGDKS